jgi:adenine specific DNA methylase Mod
LVELSWDRKYDESGNKNAPLQIALPFQTIETLNESSQQRQKSMESFLSGQGATEWRNRLIWGDKKYVLPSLITEFANSVDLIYIDPPFDTGEDFSYRVEVPDHQVNETSFTKLPSIIEQKAYRDTWGGEETHLDNYLHWFYDTVVLLEKLLKPTGSIYVHLDWHVGHYAKIILDEVFGKQNFRNEVIWHFYNKIQGNINRFATDHQVIFWYTKTPDYTFQAQYEKRPEKVKLLKRVWSKEKQMLVNARDEQGNIIYIESDKKMVDDVWRLSMLQPADKTENLGYATQKPESILKRIIEASSNKGDLVLDCFVGSGTSAAVAEKLERRWIACDLSRFSIHTTRKRLLKIDRLKPFVIQNLGKYERQAWQTSEFGEESATKIRSYISFILKLYGAQPLNGYLWLHGTKGKRFIHVGSVDSPVSSLDVGQIVAEFKRSIGTGKEAPRTNGIDVLGWDFAFELNELAKQQAAQANVDVRFLRIPREVLDRKAVEQGDIHFFELASLDIKLKTAGKKVVIAINDFVIPADDVPTDIQKEIKHWSQWVDYWAVDWNNKNDTFHNEWQEYRTREKPDLLTKASKTYDNRGRYRVVVKVVDILGNDTTKTLQVKV